MAIITLVIAIIQFVHASLLVKFRFYTLKSLLNFIEGERNNLGKKDYRQLVNRYSGITRFLEPFPDEEAYAVLYSNKEFESFVINARRKTKYYLVVTLVGFTILTAIAFWLDDVQ